MVAHLNYTDTRILYMPLKPSKTFIAVIQTAHVHGVHCFVDPCMHEIYRRIHADNMME